MRNAPYTDMLANNTKPTWTLETVLEAKLDTPQGKKAKDQLVRECMPFIVGISKHYFVPTLEQADIVSWGVLGFCEAILLFDPTKANGGNFLTFADSWVRKEILIAVDAYASGLVRIPVQMQKLIKEGKKLGFLLDGGQKVT